MNCVVRVRTISEASFEDLWCDFPERFTVSVWVQQVVIRVSLATVLLAEANSVSAACIVLNCSTALGYPAVSHCANSSACAYTCAAHTPPRSRVQVCAYPVSGVNMLHVCMREPTLECVLLVSLVRCSRCADWCRANRPHYMSFSVNRQGVAV